MGSADAGSADAGSDVGGETIANGIIVESCGVVVGNCGMSLRAWAILVSILVTSVLDIMMGVWS